LFLKVKIMGGKNREQFEQRLEKKYAKMKRKG